MSSPSQQHAAHNHSTCHQKRTECRTRCPDIRTIRGIARGRSDACCDRTNRSRWRRRIHPILAQRGRRKRRKSDRSRAVSKHRKYVFLCTPNQSNRNWEWVRKMSLTRNVSPTIQLGAEPLVSTSKNPPTHVLGPIWVSSKSAGLTGQLGPPNDIATLTWVLHAVDAYLNIDDGYYRCMENVR